MQGHNPPNAAGPGAVQYDAVAIAGGKNLTFSPSEAYPILTLKMMKDFDPEVILACGRDGDPLEELRSEKWKEVKDVSAIKNERVYFLPCGVICRPGPRVVELVEGIAKFLYPDLF